LNAVEVEERLDELSIAVFPENLLYKGVLFEEGIADCFGVVLPLNLPFAVMNCDGNQRRQELQNCSFSLSSNFKVLVNAFVMQNLLDFI
jgi:hypothetical protein